MPDHANAPQSQAVPRAVPAPLWKRIAKALVWSALGVYFAFALAVLGLRHFVLPQANLWREDIAGLLSESLGLQVAIGDIEAQWHGLHPALSLYRLQVFDQAGRPALAFDEVHTELSWTSLALRQLRLRRLAIEAPELAVRREADGSLYVAGLRMDTPEEGGGFSDWLLSQPQIVIREARVSWTDGQRGAAPLELRRVNLRLENRGDRHRFALTAEPPAALAARLDLRADLRGARLAHWQDWSGQLYAELDYADLAAWRAWVEYPMELPRGAGAMRLWIEGGGGQLRSATADVALSGVQLRFSPELPMLELDALSGRLSARRPAGAIEIAARQLALSAGGEVRVEPTDFRVLLQEASGRSPARGEFSAGMLDLQALSALAGHLPLDAAVRARLADHAPRGRVRDLRLTWEGRDGPGGLPPRYTLKTRFEGLGLAPVGAVPGGDGFRGHVDANERGGQLTLDEHEAELQMPKVFVQPRLAFASLAGQISWTLSGGQADISLQRLSFDSPDVTGSAAGRYRTRAVGPGEIDLTARLSRAEGPAVWRYIPLQVSDDVREFLRKGILAGRAEDARLRLRGDLKNWPFTRQRPGLFQVTARFGGVDLNYGDEWPALAGVSGDLLFEGKRMLIRGQSGSILNVGVSGVTAEIPDLDSGDEMLLVSGTASGPTSGFFRFIEASPVAERIDHFTRDMKATGAGSLQLKLAMPLRRIDDTRIDGEYRFVANTVEPDPELPPLTDAAGRLQFTGSSLTLRNASANLLGSPITLSANARGEGGVQIQVTGNTQAAVLRRLLDWPLLDHLSGSAAWQAGLLVRKKLVDITLESTLQGVSSSLPEPFNKTATEALPLRVERQVDPQRPGRENIKASLGQTLQATLVRRRDERGRSVVERAAIGIRDRAELPESGIVLAANLRRLDLDAWRRLAAGAENGAEGEPLPLRRVDLKAAELAVFGQHLADVSLRANRQEGGWSAQVQSRELTGELAWGSQGKGRLRARLRNLALSDAKGAGPGSAAADDLKALPALDVVAEEFSVQGIRLGRLELQAVNRGPDWRIDRLSLANPEATLTGDGQWRPGAGSATQLGFRLDVADVGRLLDRLGYANTMRRGNARLEGRLGWSGAPISIDYPSLEGTMSIAAAKGQFAKLEPGVGRLLGILSLQALPRRISLDFWDVFSEGFAFDGISGSIIAKKGVLETRDLLIEGPAAKVLMTGTVNLIDETQDLRVRVRPSLGESVALGAALVNPVVGVASLLAQKILRDPLDQIFSYEYAVSGGWADPKVEKLRPALPQNRDRRE